MIWRELRQLSTSYQEMLLKESPEANTDFMNPLLARIDTLENREINIFDVISLEDRLNAMQIAIDSKGTGGGGGGSGLDEEAFWIKVRKELDLKANKSDLEHTRTDFGMWCNKYQKELERKLNRDELANFEARLIEILSQSFADKVQNDKDHAKIFKKLQKMWGLVNSMGNQGLESPMITKQPFKQQACLACDHNITNAVRMDMGPSGQWRTPVRESNGQIPRDDRVYQMGGGFDGSLQAPYGTG